MQNFENQHSGGNSTRKCSNFPSFSKLPAELRCQIWKHLSFHPQNIDFLFKDGDQIINTEHQPFERQRTYSYSSRSPAPSILYGNRESRTEGQKWYSLEFGTSFASSSFVVENPPRIYINWEVDRLCMMNAWKFNTCPNAAEEVRGRCEVRGLRRLALNTMGLHTSKLASLVSRNSPSEELVLVRQAPMFSYRPYPAPIFTFGREPLDAHLYQSLDMRLTTTGWMSLSKGGGKSVCPAKDACF